MNPAHEKYATALEASLTRAKMTGPQIQAVVSKFLSEAARTNPERAFVQCVENYANEDGYQLLVSIAEKSKIEQGLEQLSSEHPGVDRNVFSRTKSYVERFNANIDKMSVEGVNVDKDKIKLKVPAYVTDAKQKTEWAKKIELEVRK